MTEKCEFKSAQELGLTEKQWEALITTLTLMENNSIVHIAVNGERWSGGAGSKRQTELPDGKHGFNMGDWREKYACGTVACIGGSAELFGKLSNESLATKAQSLLDDGNPNLERLFYPHNINNWDSITPKRAARVLRGYLETGKTKWK